MNSFGEGFGVLFKNDVVLVFFVGFVNINFSIFGGVKSWGSDFFFEFGFIDLVFDVVFVDSNVFEVSK